MPRGTTKRRPQTRARLLDAAMEVFAEQGFGGARIEDICDRAGYTRGAFYSNFGSKEELFLALFDARMAVVVEQVVDRVDRAEPTVDGLVTALLDYEHDRNWYLVSTEFTLHAIRNPQVAAHLAARDGWVREQLLGVLGRLDWEPGTDLEALVRMIVVIVEGAPAQSWVEPDRLPPGTLERRMLPLLLNAVRPSG
ncbi:TetR/AcrR family transcriptional regulator [Pseudonocardiaceae bacterium YIM PH 21723]|nr:TetR/AcrR family transcriptional regulator [Pseudonocardiaceae bacterium YIM PH 21723]